MNESHTVQSLSFDGAVMHLQVDGKGYSIEIAQVSECLRDATPQQREHFEISPSGYGIHWPDLDEDLSIDGLIGVVHVPNFVNRLEQAG